MIEKKQHLDTKELFSLLESSTTLEGFFQGIDSRSGNLTLDSYLTEMLGKHDCTIGQIIQRTGISKSFMYQIFNSTRVPGRDTLIRIAITMKLDLDETQKLLTLSHRGTLYPRIRRDAAIIFCLQKLCTLDQMTDLLDKIGEIPLA